MGWFAPHDAEHVAARRARARYQCVLQHWAWTLGLDAVGNNGGYGRGRGSAVDREFDRSRRLPCDQVALSSRSVDEDSLDQRRTLLHGLVHLGDTAVDHDDTGHDFALCRVDGRPTAHRRVNLWGGQTQPSRSIMSHTGTRLRGRFKDSVTNLIWN